MVDIAQLEIGVGSAEAVVATERLDRLTDAGFRAEKGVASLGAASKVQGRAMSVNSIATMRYGEALAFLANKSQGAVGGVRGLGLQLNQVAQVGAMTGKWAEALAIQLPDILLGFGTLGVYAGIAAAALIPLAMNLYNIETSGEKFKDQMEDLNKAIDAYTSSAEAAKATTSDLSKEYGIAASRAKEALEAVAAYNKEVALGQARKALASLDITATSERDRAGKFSTLGLSSMSSSDRRSFAELEAMSRALTDPGSVEQQIQKLEQLRAKYLEVAESSGGINPFEKSYIKSIDEAILAYGKLAPSAKVTMEQIVQSHQLAANTRVQAAEMAAEAEQRYLDNVTQSHVLNANVRVQAAEMAIEAEQRYIDKIIQSQQLAANTRVQAAEQERGLKISDSVVQAGITRTVSDEDVIAAQDILDSLKQQTREQQALAQYGQESVQYAELRQEAERAALEELLASSFAAESLKEEARAAMEAMHEAERADIASGLWGAVSAAEALYSRLGSVLGIIGSILGAIGQIGFDTIALNAETAALNAGKNAAEARVAGSLAQERAKLENQALPGWAVDIAMTARTKAEQDRLEAMQLRDAGLDALKPGKKGGKSDAEKDAEKQFKEDLKDAERYIENARTEVEALQVELAELARLNKLGFFKDDPEAYAESVRKVSEALREAELEPFMEGIEGTADALARMIVYGESLRENLKQVWAGIAADLISSGIRNAFISLFAPSGQQGGGTGIVGFISSMLGSLAKALPSADGGGYTGSGSRTGGVDGIGGFPIIVHPNEVITDLTKPGSRTMDGKTTIEVRAVPGQYFDVLAREANAPVFIHQQKTLERTAASRQQNLSMRGTS